LAICIYISSGRKRLFLAPVSCYCCRGPSSLQQVYYKLQYLWWLTHNNNLVCNFVVNLFPPGDLYWGSSIFRNQLFQVGSVNLSFCLHIWEHCQSSKSHDLLLASLPAMFLDIRWSSTCSNTSAQCCCIGPNGDHDHDGSWWVWVIRQEFQRIF